MSESKTDALIDDLLGLNLSGNSSTTDDEATTRVGDAPIQLMSRFLKEVAEENTSAALKLAQDILVYEPHNRMVLEYRTALTMLMAQVPVQTLHLVRKEQNAETQK